MKASEFLDDEKPKKRKASEFLADDTSTQKANAADDMKWSEQLAAGVGKAIYDTGRGLGQLGRYALPESVSDKIGLPTQADIDESRRLDADLMNTGFGFAGNVAGNIATTLLPGAALKYAGTVGNMGKVASLGDMLMTPNTIRKGAAVGATLGSLQPVASDESRVQNIGAGLVGGGIGAAVPKLLGRTLAPETRKEAANLLSEGITPTPGQILGGAWQRMEDGATSVPFVGDAIKSAQRRAIDDFNVAAYNKALAPIGGAFDNSANVGHEGVEQVYSKLSQAYDDLLPQLNIAKDATFDQELTSLQGLAQNMAPDKAAQFNKILDSALLRRFSPNGGMLGETMKEADTVLGDKIRRYSKSTVPDDQDMADALKEAQATMRRLVERSNPDKAAELSAINKGYANLMRIENAASRIGAHDGVFSPAQLKSASRQMDTSVRKRSTAQGKSLLQSFAEDGQNVLGQKVPDSGTAFRLQNMLPLGASYMLSPDLAIGALGAVGAYSKPGQKTLAALLTKRPNAVRAIGNQTKSLMPVGARLGAPSLIDFFQQD
jgi:hypothetical protein